MTRSRQSFVSKVVCTGAIAALLLGVPLQLAAQESPHAQAAALEWFASAWNDLTTWFGLAIDGTCSLDPNGCPRGGAAPAQPLPASDVDGGCSVDPNGCPGGG